MGHTIVITETGQVAAPSERRSARYSSKRRRKASKKRSVRRRITKTKVRYGRADGTPV